MTHLDLIAMARSLRDTVVDGETEQVHRDLARLRNAIVEHIRVERQTAMTAAPSPSSFVISSGQDRLLALLEKAMVDTHVSGGCNCIVQAAEIEIALRRQATLEDQRRT